MDIDKIVRQCFLQYGYAEGGLPYHEAGVFDTCGADKEKVQDVPGGLSCRKGTEHQDRDTIDELRDCDFSELLGNTIELVKGFDVNSDEILFKLTNGKIYKMYHWQDCCEDVHIDDIVGDVEDIIGSPILMAERSSNRGDEENSTWTFYKLATIKGYVTIKWYGESNGYYSEEADFAEVIQRYNYHQIGVICKEISDLQGVIARCKQEKIYWPIRPNRKELEKKLNEIQDSAEASLSIRKEQFIKLISPIL